MAINGSTARESPMRPRATAAMVCTCVPLPEHVKQRFDGGRPELRKRSRFQRLLTKFPFGVEAEHAASVLSERLDQQGNGTGVTNLR